MRSPTHAHDTHAHTTRTHTHTVYTSTTLADRLAPFLDTALVREVMQARKEAGPPVEKSDKKKKKKNCNLV